MDLAELLKVIVPLVVMAVWVFNLLFNKETTQTPPRTNQQPRPSFDPAEIEASRDEAFAYSRGLPPQGQGQGQDREESETAPRPIVIQRPDGSYMVVTVDPRPAQRARAARQVAEREKEGARERERERDRKNIGKTKIESSVGKKSGLINAGINQTLSSNFGEVSSIQLTPLNKETEAPAVAHTPMMAGTTSKLSAQLQEVARTPAKIRQAILLNEILGPPLALRGHAHRSAMAPPLHQ